LRDHPAGSPLPQDPGTDELHRQVFERNLAVQLLLDPEDGRIVEANPAACRFYGYDRAQLTGMRITQINTMPPSELRELMGAAVEERRNAFLFRHRLASGEVRDVEVHSGPVEIGGRRLLYSIIHDVTERVRAQEALTSSEATFRLVFANHPLPMWVYDEQSLRFLEVNAAAVHAYGWTRDEFLGMRITDIRPPEEVGSLLERLRQPRPEVAPRPTRSRHCRRDGASLEVEVLSHRIDFGSRSGILVVSQDVTDRERALEALRASEEKYRAILAGIDEGYYEVDLAGRFTFANDALRSMLGEEESDLRGRSLGSWVSADTGDELGQAFEQVAQTGQPTRYLRFEVVRGDGARRAVEGSVSLLRGAHGEADGFRGILTDVTEREQRDAELRDSEERFRRLVEMSPDGIAIYCEGRVVFCNTAGARLVGATSPEEVLGRGLDDFVHPESKAVTRDRLQRLRQGQDVPFVELKYLRMDGSTIEVEAAATPFLWRDRPAAQVVVRDISARKRSDRLQRALYRIAQTSTTNQDMGALYASIHGIVGELMYARNFYIALVDPVSGTFGFDYFVDEEDPVPPTVKPGRSLTDYVLRTGEPLLADAETFADLEARNEIELLGAPSIDWLGVPLKRGRECFGALVVQSYNEEHRYTVADRDVLTFVSQHVATAIDRRRAASALEESEDRFRTLAETAPCAIFIYQGDRFRYANPAMSAISGYTREELMETNFWSMVHPEFREMVRERGMARQKGQAAEVPGTYEFQIVRKDGEVRWVQFSAGVIERDGQPAGLGTAFDITERKRAEEQIRSLAYLDPLTGLPNRLLFNDRVTVAVAQAHRLRQRLAVLFLDLDRFKIINDSLGHSIGDRLLQEVAARLLAAVREGDTVARLGGDEFTLLLPAVVRAEDAAKIAEKLLESLRQSFRLDGRELFVTSSLGISLYPDDGHDAESLVKNADTAMYRAKEEGRDNYQLYTRGMNATAVERLALESSLRKALAQQELLLYYQPLLDLGTGRVHGVEALLRWRHPERGLVPPSEFIPLAELTGLIVGIGNWSLRVACQQAREWQKSGHPNLTMAVNLSVRQFNQPDLAAQVRRALMETELPARSLDLEITESNAMQNAEGTIQTLRELKTLGVRVSIDDFGIGYSSLSYLKRLPIDTLKIDQSFVRDITTDPDDAAIATAVIALAHTLKLKVVGEGVETEEQLAFLAAQHCDRVQGFLFSPPLSAADCTQFLARNRPL
jgi:diguanylate cyclase (GGDEF)-like protein/PAS domain S-box-containing protein